MKTITVNLPDRLVTHLEQRVASGEFDSLDGALASAGASIVPYTGENRITAETTADELRAMLQVGFDQAERGECVDGPTAMAELRRRTQARVDSLAVPS